MNGKETDIGLRCAQKALWNHDREHSADKRNMYRRYARIYSEEGNTFQFLFLFHVFACCIIHFISDGNVFSRRESIHAA